MAQKLILWAGKLVLGFQICSGLRLLKPRITPNQGEIQLTLVHGSRGRESAE